jgi:metallo-beta-lactamase class B
MSARSIALVLAAFASTGCSVSLPIQPEPPQVERPVAPIETSGPAFAAACKDRDDWDKPAPPVRIYGNTYLVGTCGISAILITGSEGHILIDSGTEAGGDVVADNIRRLGFQLHDVKILLHSHEHFDHVGGIARLQQLTGAQLFASPEAARVLETGINAADDPQAGIHEPFATARVDRIVRDGESVRLGNLALVALSTPGHTPGALSWHWSSCDGGVCRRIVYADSLSPVSRDDYRFSDHPDYVASYRAGLAKLAALDCDILLTPHPSASNMIARMAGSRPLENSDGCRLYAESIGKRLDERIAKEQAQ